MAVSRARKRCVDLIRMFAPVLCKYFQTDYAFYVHEVGVFRA